MIRIEKSHMIAARRSLGLHLNALLRLRALWLSTPSRVLLSLRAEQPACTGRAQEVWKNASLPRFFTTLACLGLLQCNRFALRALRREPERSRALRRNGCRMGQSAEDLMGFTQGCLLSRAAVLDRLPSISEPKVLRQKIGPGPISDGGNRLSDAGGFTAVLDLDRKRPRLASHVHCVAENAEGLRSKRL